MEDKQRALELRRMMSAVFMEWKMEEQDCEKRTWNLSLSKGSLLLFLDMLSQAEVFSTQTLLDTRTFFGAVAFS